MSTPVVAARTTALARVGVQVSAPQGPVRPWPVVPALRLPRAPAALTGLGVMAALAAAFAAAAAAAAAAPALLLLQPPVSAHVGCDASMRALATAAPSAKWVSVAGRRALVSGRLARLRDTSLRGVMGVLPRCSPSPVVPAARNRRLPDSGRGPTE